MIIRQSSVFVENRVGGMAEVAEILGEGGINIKVASIADTAEFGILRMIVDDCDKAVKILTEHGIAVKFTDVCAVLMPHRPNGLSQILKALSGKGINLEYVYAFVDRRKDSAIVVFKPDDLSGAEDALKSSHISGLDVQSVIDML